MRNSFGTYVQKGLRSIFLIAVSLTILVYILDAIILGPSIPGKSLVNYLTAAILLISLALHLLGKFKLEIYFSLLAYTIIVSGILSFYLYLGAADFLPLLLRDSIFLLSVITISGFALDKRHAVIFSILVILNIILISFISQNPFLLKNVTGLSMVLVFYTAVFYYFLGVRDGFINEMEVSNSKILEQNSEIHAQNELLRNQQEEIQVQSSSMETQNSMIEKKSRDILDNLIFARNIQKTILPKEIEYLNYLPDSFILHLPKDEISGDFYWIREMGRKLYIAAVDCTGHGMSGALVSMIGFLSLNRAIVELSDPNPAEILNKLDSIFQTEFNHSHEDFNSKIGMDIALITLDLEAMKLEFSGAFNPLYIVRNGELIRFKANHYMLGIEVDEFFHNFTNHQIDVFPGDSMYIFSDGMADQFGSKTSKKFSYERLRKTFVALSELDMKDQREELRRIWLEWKGDQEQTDDILVMGFRL